MFHTRILDCEVNGEKKPIEFYTVQALEYYLGWNKDYFKVLEDKTWFPRTPYIQEIKRGTRLFPMRLYTRTMLQEVVELVENHYPVLYRGRDPIRKQRYVRELDDYGVLVKELQDKWNREDYLAKEPATYPPMQRRKNAQTR
jgi:hypothetical protein